MRTDNKNEIKKILDLLHKVRGYDFTGCSMPMLNRRIEKRIFATKTDSFNSYLKFLQITPEEFDALVDVLTINVSKFFRNPIYFEYLFKIIIPLIVSKKLKNNDSYIRIWSAGCAAGEEPYSIAINIYEYLEKEIEKFNISIFATDIDENSLAIARKGKYNFDSIEEVKTGILKKYFTCTKDGYIINSKIKEMIDFSFFDLLDKKKSVPPESIFGGFDIVLCRNVLIYFNTDYHKIIFGKIAKALNPGGYLILGEAEVISEEFTNIFKRVSRCCKIYRKIV